MTFFQIKFTDMLNQEVLGGTYVSFTVAILTARGICKNGAKSSWKIIRIKDGIVLAQSKAAQS